MLSHEHTSILWPHDDNGAIATYSMKGKASEWSFLFFVKLLFPRSVKILSPQMIIQKHFAGFSGVSTDRSYSLNNISLNQPTE